MYLYIKHVSITSSSALKNLKKFRYTFQAPYYITHSFVKRNICSFFQQKQKFIFIHPYVWRTFFLSQSIICRQHMNEEGKPDTVVANLRNEAIFRVV